MKRKSRRPSGKPGVHGAKLPGAQSRPLAGSSSFHRFVNSLSQSPWLPGLILFAITLIAYLPAWHAGFIWDDDDYVINNTTLRSLDGLRQIWFVIDALPQYYPLVHTTFWLEYHLWGLNPLGYHLVNIGLHATGAVLLWRVLKRLQLPGAWLAAAIFAIHPVEAESVAWVTERKNVLSAVCYFAAALAYLRFLQPAGAD